MNLKEFQTRLELRYAGLAKDRLARGLGHSVFALEHGLLEADLNQMQSLLRDRISKLGVLERDYWLPWIIYAAEIGYHYSGDEYWHTFAQDTPGWDNRYRHKIRDWYERFEREYSGVRPSGDWAAHFSIIAWPINHAIIPQDLQRFLAQVLYEARNDIALMLDDHARLGQRIAVWAHATSDRFRQFVGQHQLVGQIAAALLLAGEEDTSGLLSKETLHRIKTDLEREISSRNWMKAARASVSQLRRFGLQAPTTGSRSLSQAAQSGGALSRRRPVLAPQLVLEPRGPHSWAMLLETPDLTALFEENPSYRDRLLAVRCRIAGAKDGFFSRGYLCAPRLIPLRSLPAPAQPLVQFEQPVADIDRIFNTEFILRTSPARLFRISADNVGVEVKAPVVRPGGRYVLLTAPDQCPQSPPFESGTVECSGVLAAEFTVSDAKTAAILEPILRKYSILVDRWLAIRPVALPPKLWDGQGAGRWLSTDEPLFELNSSLPIDEYKLVLGEEMPSVVAVQQAAVDRRVFIQLPKLSAGEYVLTISGRQSGNADFQRLGRLDIGVDDPSVWIPGISRGILEAVVTPPAADLDDFWSGRASLQVLGPSSHAVTPVIELLNARDQVLASQPIPSLRLPIEPAVWEEHFLRHAQRHPVIERHFDAAASLRLILKTPDLGEISLNFERRLTRLRWRIVGNNGVVRVQLIDHNAGAPPRVSFMPCASPAVGVPLESNANDERFECAAAGVIVASVEADHDSLVVAPMPKVDMQLSDLRGAAPKIVAPKLEVKTVSEFVNVIETWADARLPGSGIAAIQRNFVLRELHRSLFGALCGAPWQKAEIEAEAAVTRLVDQRASGEEQAKAFFRRLGRDLDRMSANHRLIDGLLRDAADFVDQDAMERVRHLVPFLRPLLPHFDVPLVTQFSLRLASAPETIARWAGKSLPSLLGTVIRRRWLLKASRFVALAVDQMATGRGEQPPLRRVPIYGGWQWS